MERVISISLGEIVLKGKNRKSFESKLIGQVKAAIKDIGYRSVYKDMGKVYIACDFEDFDEVIRRVRNVFGIVYVSPCLKVERDEESIEEGIKIMVSEYLEDHPELKTFKGVTKRADKGYHLKSMDVNRIIGGAVLKNFPLKVDVHNPDFYVYCDIKKEAYIYIERFDGYGGLPVGTNGKGLLLLSGGIDSPVAGFLMAKRGIAIDALNFHSYPFTSERSEEKVYNLGAIMSAYTGDMTIYSINILNIQKAINENCPAEEMTIISRRFMMRLADKIAEKKGYKSIITGESLGQVASQTIDGLTVTNAIPTRPVFRPLIGTDKVQIIEWAKRIGTFETSIIQAPDCCTVFLPKHPALRPKLEEIEESEAPLNIEELLDDAVANMKIVKVKDGEWSYEE